MPCLMAALLCAVIRPCESHALCSCDVHVGVMRGEQSSCLAAAYSSASYCRVRLCLPCNYRVRPHTRMHNDRVPTHRL